MTLDGARRKTITHAQRSPRLTRGWAWRCPAWSAARENAFNHSSVLRTEALGSAAIDLMNALWEAIYYREDKDLRSKRKSARANYIFSLISLNYIEQAEKVSSESKIASGLRYRELRLLTDMVSGMTDTFAMRLWDNIKVIPDAHRT